MKLSTIIVVICAISSGTALFWVSQNVQRVERDIARLEQAKEREEEMMRVLKAEWHYLNRPDRLEALAKDHLGYDAIDSDYILDNVDFLPNKPLLYTPKPIKINHPEEENLESIIENLVYDGDDK